nr:unnamed protein product [Callosobruchus analis]
MGVNYSGTAWFCVRGWCFLPRYPFLSRIPLQAAQGDIPNEDLPLQHQQSGSHLLRYPER